MVRTNFRSNTKSALRSRNRTARRLATAFPGVRKNVRPAAAYRQRGIVGVTNSFNAPELWHAARPSISPPENFENCEPSADNNPANAIDNQLQTGASPPIRYVVQPAGEGYHHPVTREEVAARLAELPPHLVQQVEVVQFSRMTRKRSYFPCYGMQWGQTVYLYPIEESHVEIYRAPPTPQQRIEACMYGGIWEQTGRDWRLIWTPETIRDFYLNNVLIHEVGHINDLRHTNMRDRERYANWFAIEHGYRHSRGRRPHGR